MTDLKDKTVLIYDRGLWPSMAERLARKFGTALYYSEWRDVAPRFAKYLVGTGLPNVTRVKSFWHALDRADLVVFCDVNDGDLQEHLRDIGKPVWGCLGADELEIHRWEARQVFRKVGLEVPNGQLIHGMSALREHLKKVEDKYVKISVFRGDFETSHHENYRLSETRLDDFVSKVGPPSEDVEFIVDDPINDAVEIGYDGGFGNGHFWPVAMYGYEIKDKGYAGRVCAIEDLPEDILYVNMRLAPILAKYGYCGFFTTEIRRRRDGPPVLMELTTRAPSPPGELAMEMWTNLPEMMWSAAVDGEMVTPEPLDKYGAEIMIYSDWSDNHFTALEIPEEVRPWTKLCFAMRYAGYPQIVPQKMGWAKVGGVVATGSTLAEACLTCAARAAPIKGNQIDGDSKSLDDAEEVVQKGKKFGIPF